MANNCWNTISLIGNKDSLKELEDRLYTYDKFNYLNGWCDYVLKIRDDFNYIREEDERDAYHYGSKWFDFEINDDPFGMSINGDSAWSPLIEFTKQICKVYKLDGVIEYEEPGLDFAGIVTYGTEGNEVSNIERTYCENLYVNDRRCWLEEMMDTLPDYEEEDLLEELEVISKYTSKEDLCALRYTLSAQKQINKW